MAITAKQVRDLRERTGLPMMECKQALTECDGNEDAAIEFLTKKYKGKMEERQSKETGEGRVVVCLSDDGKTGSIIRFECETEPVSNNEDFVKLAEDISKHVLAQNDMNPSPEAILEQEYEGKKIADKIADVFGTIRENMKLGECRKLTGEHLVSYVHHDNKKGVLIALDAKPSDAQVGTDLCHHVTFCKPMAITRDQIPAENIEKVRNDAIEEAKEQGKPEQIVEKIAQGKVNAYCSQNALMDQEHVKPDYDRKSVGEVMKAAGVNTVLDYAYLQIGS